MQDGYSIRAFATAGAPRIAALVALIETIEAFDEHPDPSDEGDVRELLSRPHFEASSDLVVAMSGEALIGWAAAVSRPSSVRFVRSGLRGGVHPAHRRTGVGSALLAWSEQRGRDQMAAADPSLPRWLAVEALESQSSLRRLAHQHGFEERRWFIDMKRRLDAVPEPVEPDGIRIVPWADEFADQVLLADTEAFADHWGSTPLDPETWTHLLAAPGTRLDLSFIALDGDKVVAYSFNQAWPDEDETDGERVAWVDTLGTLRSHRRRGIAGSLLDHSHVRFAQAGFTHAMLNVDADSPTNAGSIYAAHGYEPLHRLVVTQKEYRESAGVGSG